MTQDQLVQMFSPLMVTFVTALLTAIAAYAVAQFKKIADKASVYIEAKIGVSDYDLLRILAKDTVLSVTQHPAYKDLLSDEKKQVAMTTLTGYINQRGLIFTADQLSDVIEAVYAEVKKDLGAPTA